MYRVVLVDDEPVIAEGLKRIVPWTKYNCEIVAVANNAQDGKSTILKHKPDILFTDIRMPDQDGLTMLAGLRSQFPNMQVIVLSGYSDFHFAQEAIRLGVCRFLLKPSKMHEIQEAVYEAVTRIAGESKENIDHDTDDLANVGGFIIARACAYMEEHYAEKLVLQSVAEKCYISQWHLSKLLNKQLGQNFYALLNSIRVKKAKELLRDPSLKINDICEMTGYMDTAHFSRVFKSIVGMSASSYRNSIEESNIVLHKQI